MKDKLDKKHRSREKNDALMFSKTFIAAFLIIMVIATPLFTRVGEVLDMTLGDEDSPVLEERVNFAELIPTNSPFFDVFTETNRINILALGVDKHNLTDTIMLVSFDIDNQFIDVISIPRDTYYYRGPGFIGRAHHKVNAVFRGNPVNTAMAVSNILMNIPINYYVLLSWEGVSAIVDEIGGVPMYIPFHMRYDDVQESPPLHIDIRPGHQVLDGETSIGFLRFRQSNPGSGYRGYPDSDFGRIRAQHEFVRSAVRQSLGFNLPNIARTVFENVQSDITIRTVLHLAARAIGMDSENIRVHQIPVNQNDDGDWIPDVQGIRGMLTEIYSMEEVVFDGEGIM